MIISLCVATGFRNEIRDKVIGFGSHIQINSYSDAQPINIKNAHFYPSLEKEDNITHIQMYATKPAIIQNLGDTVYFDNESGNEQMKIDRDVQGVMCKGIGKDFDWSFIENKLVEGKILDLEQSRKQNEILISRYVANKLKLTVNTKIDLYLLHGEKPSKRVFEIIGIYETGFEEYDRELAFIDIRHIQKLNKWGVETNLNIVDTCFNNQLMLEATCYGGLYERDYRFNFGKSWQVGSILDPHTFRKPFCLERDTTIMVIASEFSRSPNSQEDTLIANFIPDTAWLDIRIERLNDSISLCHCTNDEFGTIPVEISDDGYAKIYRMKHLIIETKLRTSGGTYDYYVGGFEVTTTDFDELDENTQLVKEATHSIGHSTYQVQSIEELRQDIFGWLEMLDMNVIIILSLTIFVAVINMSSALLVLILERTNMIGILKAMGSDNWTIRKIFLYNATYLIGKGMLWGNVIGIGFCLLQQQFQLVPLPTETYYLSSVPININIWHIILLNLCTISFCTLAMIIPSYMITKITPVKAIKFN